MLLRIIHAFWNISINIIMYSVKTETQMIFEFLSLISFFSLILLSENMNYIYYRPYSMHISKEYIYDSTILLIFEL